MSETNKIKISIDGKEAEMTVAAVSEEIADLTTRLKGLDEASELFVELTSRIKLLQDALAGVGLGLDVSDAKRQVDDLSASVDSLASKEPIVLPVSADPTALEESIGSIESMAAEPITVPVEADTDPAQAQIDGLSSDRVEVPVEADVDPAQAQIDGLAAEPIEVPVTVDPTDAKSEISSIGDELEPVEVPVSTETAVSSIKELKQQLRETNDEIARSEFGSDAFIRATQRSGELKEQINDINEAINSQRGEAVERLGSQFRGIGDSLSKLDFKEASEKLKTFQSTLGQLDFKGIAQGAGQFAKQLGGGVVDAFKSLGKAILANPILLIATVIIGVGTALFKLKDSIKPVQVIFDALGDAIGFVTDLLKGFSDLIGLTNFEETEAIEKTTKAYEDQSKAIEETTKLALASAKARGASEEELLAIQQRSAEDRKKLAQAAVDAGAAELQYLQDRLDAGRELSDEQQKNYERDVKNLTALKEINVELLTIQKEQADLARERASAELAAENQIAILTAKTDKSRLEAQKQAVTDAAAAAAEKARLEGKSEAEIDAIVLKGLDDRNKLQDDFDRNALAKAKARREAIASIEEKYDTDQRARIERAFDDDLKKLAENGVREGKVVQEIQAAKLKALDDFDREQRQRAEELADRQLQLQTEITIKAAEAQARLAVENAPDPRAAAKAQIEADREITELRVQAIEENKRIQLEALAETTAAQVEQAGLTEEQITEIVRAGELEQQKIQLDSDAQVAKEREDQAKRERDAAIKAISEIEAKRQALASSNTTLNLFDLEDRTGQLQSLADQELSIQEDLLDRKLINEEQYAASVKAINEQLEKDKAAASEAAIQTTVNQAQALVQVAADFAQGQADAQAAQLEADRTQLEAEYERRRELIENTIADETKKKQALEALDAEFDKSRTALDKKAIALQKAQIKRERNVAVAQIILANAIAIADAAKIAGQSSGNLIQFFITLGAVLLSVATTIYKAKAALAQADAAAAAVGAGGGQSVPDSPASGAAAAPGGVGSSGTPAPVPTFTPSGVNSQFGQGPGQGQEQPPIVVNAQVSVEEINRVQNRVSVAETSATIG